MNKELINFMSHQYISKATLARIAHVTIGVVDLAQQGIPISPENAAKLEHALKTYNTGVSGSMQHWNGDIKHY